ncbi:MAG: hypothetical protein FWF82_07645 [Oscillospiraceae bacterium]|nr:hypothetical protein [Oscillospiraceae bacterium]
MIYFYFIIFVISASAFTADCILRYMEKIKGFDFGKKLFKISSENIPLDKFFPENLTMLILAVMVASAAGSGYTLGGLAWYLSLPASFGAGFLICFFVQYFGEGMIDIVMKNRLPKGESAAGLDGYCTESVKAGDWGKVRVLHTGKSGVTREYEVNAVMASSDASEESDSPDKVLNVGDKVIVLYESDGFYYVVRVDKIFIGL